MIRRTVSPSPKGDITLFTITNAGGASVTLSTLGAGVVAVCVPDRKGNLADVALGYADAADYIADGPCAGKVPGRYANRIANGKLTIDGKNYELPVNNGPNHLHGGPEGFQNQIWKVESAENQTVVFTHISPDGDSGYPGELKVKATYTWTDSNELYLTLEATTDASTVVNLTNHTYWNLAGHASGSILSQKLWLKASSYLPTESTLIPEGAAAPVAGTPMDFTAAKELGRDIYIPFPALKFGKGYDNCWVIDNRTPGVPATAAILADDTSGRVLKVETDQPGVQVYTGNWLAGSPASKAGRSYNDYDGVAIECQDFPNSPNTPAFPSTLLRPGERYIRHINFKFTTQNA